MHKQSSVLIFYAGLILLASIVIFLQIQKCEVDGLDVQSSGCTIDLQWKGSGETVPLSHRVTLKGAKPPRNFFTLSYHPCKEKQTNSSVSCA